MIGKLSSFFGRPLWLALFALQFVLVIGITGYVAYSRSSDGCIACHSDKERMTRLGHPYLVVTQEQVEKEARHRGVYCVECHEGDGRADDPDEAHEGMLKAIYVGHQAERLDRKKEFKAPLLPYGDDDLRSLLPVDTSREGSVGEGSWVRNLLYHDRNPETYGYDPVIGKRACGQSDCHPDQVRQFSKTIMGANIRQRTMKSWLEPYGPHNCGPSFADTPPMASAVGDRFDFTNTGKIKNETNQGFSHEQAVVKQKFCNACHAGCLDCHFTPFDGKGAHSFSKKPPSQSCTGGGRGSSMCHSGSMERRRGDSYLGGDFSEPAGLAGDVHLKKKIDCVDCHATGPGGMGDIRRAATCGDCHLEAERALAASEHKNVSCAACHVGLASGYQLTHWGPGDVAGEPNPFAKYSLYFGTVTPPILIKDQKGVWIPVKVWPHSLANFGRDVPASNGILFRWPNGETRDAYALLGTFDGLPSGNKHLAWLEIEELAHPYGKSRTCASCHGAVQRARSEWTFVETEAADPFSGRYEIEAGREGLHIKGIEATTPIVPTPGVEMTSFAPWVYLGDIWKVKGDFSIPSRDAEKAAAEFDAAMKKLEGEKTGLGEKAYVRVREVMSHNTRMGREELSNPPSAEIRIRAER